MIINKEFKIFLKDDFLWKENVNVSGSSKTAKIAFDKNKKILKFALINNDQSNVYFYKFLLNSDSTFKICFYDQYADIYINKLFTLNQNGTGELRKLFISISNNEEVSSSNELPDKYKIFKNKYSILKKKQKKNSIDIKDIKDKKDKKDVSFITGDSKNEALDDEDDNYSSDITKNNNFLINYILLLYGGLTYPKSVFLIRVIILFVAVYLGQYNPLFYLFGVFYVTQLNIKLSFNYVRNNLINLKDINIFSLKIFLFFLIPCAEFIIVSFLIIQTFTEIQALIFLFCYPYSYLTIYLMSMYYQKLRDFRYFWRISSNLSLFILLSYYLLPVTKTLSLIGGSISILFSFIIFNLWYKKVCTNQTI